MAAEAGIDDQLLSCIWFGKLEEKYALKWK
jgi:hypothetical protein